MKNQVTCVLVLTILVLYQVAAASTETVYGYPVETENLRIVWADEAGKESLGMVERTAEQLYHQTVAFVRDEPVDKVMVVFRGRARIGPGAGRDYPFVDGSGVVNLFRFTDDIGNYFNAFVHELVHALRIDRAESADWFFEEGFAEFVRLRVYDSMQGFPWYGFDPDVVAAGHIVDGSAIPLERIRAEHDQLNIRCRAQVYALRAAFFEWLGNRYGDDAVLGMSQEKLAGQSEHYKQYFGLSFQELEVKWLADMREAHDADKFKAYRNGTPVRHIPLCDL